MAKKLWKNEEAARTDIRKSIISIEILMDTLGRNMHNPGSLIAIGDSIVKHIKQICEGMLYIRCGHFASPDGTEEYPQLKDLARKGDLVEASPLAKMAAKCLTDLFRDAGRNGLDIDGLSGIIEASKVFVEWVSNVFENGDDLLAIDVDKFMKTMHEFEDITREMKSLKTRDWDMSPAYGRFQVLVVGDTTGKTDEEIDEMYRPRKMNSRKSMLALFVYLILKEYSSVNNPLRQDDIIEILEEEYELKVERKSLGRCLHNLADEDVHVWLSERVGCWYSEEEPELDFEE